MKRFLIILLTVSLLLATGCSNNPSLNSNQMTEASGKATDDLSAPTDNSTPTPDPTEPMFVGYKNDTICYINYKGDILNETASSIGFSAENGLAPAPNAEGKYGFVDKDGIFVIDPQYIECGIFSSQGLAPVAAYDEDGNKKWGFINASGDIVIDLQFDAASSFYQNGYAVVGVEQVVGYETFRDETVPVTETFYGVIDTSGAFCVEPLYTGLAVNKDYICASTDNSSDYHILADYTGNVIDTISSDSYGTYYCQYDTIRKIENSTAYILIDNTFEEFMHIQETDADSTYYEIHGYTSECKQSASTVSGNAYNLKKGDFELASYQYDYVAPSSCTNYLIGYKYKDRSTYSFDIYDLRSGTKTAENLSYQFLTTFPDLSGQQQALPEGYFLVKTYGSSGKYGIIDCAGAVIVEPVYSGLIAYNFEANNTVEH